MRAPRSVALTIVTFVSLSACNGDEAKGDAEKKATPATEISTFADKVTAAFDKDGKKFKATDVMVFCVGGNLLANDPLLGTLDFKPGANFDYCYNVSSDLKKVALSVAESPMAETRQCVFLDGSSGAVKRGDVKSQSEPCMP